MGAFDDAVAAEVKKITENMRADFAKHCETLLAEFLRQPSFQDTLTREMELIEADHDRWQANESRGLWASLQDLPYVERDDCPNKTVYLMQIDDD